MAEKPEKSRHQAHAEESARKRALMLQLAEKQRREEAKLRIAYDAVAKIAPGKVVLAHLFHLCGYNVSSLVRRGDGEIAELGTEAQEAQRLIYIKVRKLLSPELRVAIETLAESQSEIKSPEEK